MCWCVAVKEGGSKGLFVLCYACYSRDQDHAGLYSVLVFYCLFMDVLLFVSADKTVITPPGAEYHGAEVDTENIVAVSIIRAGDSMLDTFLEVCPEAKVGKILIQR